MGEKGEKGEKGGEAGIWPGRALIMPLVLMMVTPFIALLLIETNLVHGGDFVKMGAALLADPRGALLGSFKVPSWPTIQMLLAFAAFELALMRLVPGKVFIGPVSPVGDRPRYTANGFQCFILTLLAFFVFSDIGLGYFKATIVYDHYAEALSALTVGSFAFCALLYVKGHVAPSSADSGTNGNFIIDYYWGMELYPRILGWDVKMFTNCRWGMMAWAIFPLSFAAKNMELNGGQLSWAMALNVALQLVYIAKFFLWETGYLATMDIQHDRAGFYICWGCLVWVPSVYVSHSLYLVQNSPAWLGAGWAAAIFLLGAAAIFVNYDADRQRGLARATDGKCTIWGRPARVLPARYTTERGEVKDTILLADGWWSVSRHFHYVPELCAAFLWSLPGGFQSPMPYVYFIFLVILLTDRAFRDESRMQNKYGKDWEAYCKLVPWKIVPGIV